MANPTCGQITELITAVKSVIIQGPLVLNTLQLYFVYYDSLIFERTVANPPCDQITELITAVKKFIVQGHLV